MEWPWIALSIAAIAVLVRVAWPAGLELYGDEAYYYLWSRRLSSGYFDHPPMVAWLVRAGTLLGHSEFAVRLPFALCGAVATFFSAGIAHELTPDRRAPALAALLCAVAPLTVITSSLALPDGPLTAAVAACTYWVVRNRGADLGWAGLAFGLALLSKYSAALLLPGFIWIALRDPAVREAANRVPAWLGALAVLVLVGPCVWWNAEHGFASVAFQWHHASGSRFAPSLFAAFAGVEAVGAGPLTLALAAPLLVFADSAARRRFRVLTWWPLFGFGYAALRGKFEANWPAMCNPSLCAAAAVGLSWCSRRWVRGLALFASAAPVAALIVIGLELRQPRWLSPSNINVVRFHQGRALARAVRERLEPGPPPFVFTYDYQDAGELAFYGGFTRLGPVYERASQLDVWNDLPGAGEVFAFVGYWPPPAGLAARFAGSAPLSAADFTLLVGGQVVRHGTVVQFDHFSELQPR